LTVFPCSIVFITCIIRREVSENDLVARDPDPLSNGKTEAISSREVDIADLEEREPFFFLAP
jgi:hypothetical protein